MSGVYLGKSSCLSQNSSLALTLDLDLFPGLFRLNSLLQLVFKKQKSVPVQSSLPQIAKITFDGTIFTLYTDFKMVD